MANIYDDIINGTFSNPAMQTSGWGKPIGNAQPAYSRQGTSGVAFNPAEGFVPGAIPTSGDRLPQGTAGLPNPSPGSGLTPQQLAAMGGWSVDNQTGQLSYANPSQNQAATAAGQMAAGVPLPRPRPPWAPTAIDMAAINGQQGANPGLGGALIGNGQMSSAIPPQQPPNDGSPATVWAGDNGGGSSAPAPAPITQGTDGYTYQNGKVVGLTDWGQRVRDMGLGPAGQYASANQSGQLNAMLRGYNARQQGQTTMIDKLRAQGMSPSDAYSAANAVDYSGSGYSAADRLGAQLAARGGGGGDSLMSNQSGPAPTQEQYLQWKASQSQGTGLNPQQVAANLARNRP